jgi:catechol 2,3-dioxygenase-like lactoylglutathione lyase family enzyme
MGSLALDHVQIAIPPGGEEQARAFFSGILGLAEIAKPAELSGFGGCWFELGDRQLHVGADSDFQAARKAHVAIRVSKLADFRARLVDAGCDIQDDAPLDGRARFFTSDPFGNRIEFIEPVL